MLHPKPPVGDRLSPPELRQIQRVRICLMASPPRITVVEGFEGVQGSTYPRVSTLSQAPGQQRGEGATEPAGDVLHFLTEDLRAGAPHTFFLCPVWWADQMGPRG